MKTLERILSIWITYPIKEEAENCLLFVAQYVVKLLQFDKAFVVVVLSENLSGLSSHGFQQKLINYNKKLVEQKQSL